MDHPTVWTVLFFALVFLGIYLLPALIGFKRGIANRFLLLAVNLFFGWTVLGWVVCLIWAVVGATAAQDAFYRRQGNM